MAPPEAHLPPHNLSQTISPGPDSRPSSPRLDLDRVSLAREEGPRSRLIREAAPRSRSDLAQGVILLGAEDLAGDTPRDDLPRDGPSLEDSLTSSRLTSPELHSGRP